MSTLATTTTCAHVIATHNTITIVFVGRRTKGRKGGVEALRNDSGVSVTSTKGKLKVLQSHYQHLGSCSVDDAFDGNWKQEVDSKVNECHRCSVEHDDPVLDREIELQEIARCVRNLKITRLVVVMDLWESFSSMEGQG